MTPPMMHLIFTHMFILHRHRMVNRRFALKIHPKDMVYLTLLVPKTRLDPINSLFSILGYVLKCLNKNCPPKGRVSMSAGGGEAYSIV